MPFAFEIGVAAVSAGCGGRTVGWGKSCCCSSRRRSTEPLLFFALTPLFLKWTVSLPSTRKIAQSARDGIDTVRFGGLTLTPI